MKDEMLTIAVLAYHTDNSTKLTDDCITSIDSQSLPDTEIEKLLVDNGSTPPLPPYKGWTVARLSQNIGGIAGQNFCFFCASYPWVLFVSNDVRLLPNCIRTMWELRQGWRQSMPIILNPDGTIQSCGGILKYPAYGMNSKWTSRIDYIPSIIYLMPKLLVAETGGFDEGFPMSYEDVDMGRQLGRKRVTCIHSARAYHIGNATLQFKNNEKFKLGRKMFIKKHFRGLDKWLRLLTITFLDAIIAVKKRVLGR